MNATLNTMVAALTPDERYLLDAEVEARVGAWDMADEALVLGLVAGLMQERAMAEAGKARVAARAAEKLAARRAVGGRVGRIGGCR
jgi:hypothetical protein